MASGTKGCPVPAPSPSGRTGPRHPSSAGLLIRAACASTPRSRAVETRTLAAGSLYVPLDTELANVAIALLEPESPDSLFAWGELSSCLEEGEYMDTRVLDPLAG